MPESAIDVEHLRVIRGGKPVLPDISFDVPAGSVTGLLGPSGSGKSTLIRSIVGVQIVAGGKVTVLGEPAGSRPLRARVAYVTQAPSVYGDLTVRENLAYFASVVGAPERRIGSVLRSVKLRPQADQLVDSLSGGQRSRVSLATALLVEPELLVLDEPTTGLDPVLREDLWKTFRELAERGTTLLVSSHVMDEAAHCDRLLLLRDGKLLASETPAGLLRKTRAKDLDTAFLRLIERRKRARPRARRGGKR